MGGWVIPAWGRGGGALGSLNHSGWVLGWGGGEFAEAGRVTQQRGSSRDGSNAVHQPCCATTSTDPCNLASSFAVYSSILALLCAAKQCLGAAAAPKQVDDQ